jgi:hypothetical protein
VEFEHPHSFKFRVSTFKRIINGVKRRTGIERWARALLAVLLGNLAYFAAMPRLPAVARHVPFRPDLGLLLDCLICTAVFVLLSLAWR